jgi:superfamily II DNA or RNA helicase
MKLRPYQRDQADAVFSEFQQVNSTLVVSPTGTGKTILAANIAYRVANPPPPRSPKRVMLLAHRKELIYQAKDKIEKMTGLRAEIEMGDQRVGGTDSLFTKQPPIVVSSVQTQCSGGDGGGRMSKFSPDEFGLLILDEAHHATSPTYKRIIDYYRTNPDLKIVGITATPDRADEEALGQVFESVAYDYEILDAIHDGWLVPVDQQMVTVADLDFSRVRTTAGDLNGADLSAIMESERILQEIAGPTIEIVGDKRAIVFTASVKHAECLSNILNRHRTGMAEWVCGMTEDDKRKDILARFADGRTQVVANCSVLIEGFDNPAVEVIVMGRPTKSRNLYAQMCGRSLRPLPGIVDGLETAEERKAAIAKSKKVSALILDFVGNSGKHKLMTSADILGGKESQEVLDRAIARAKEGRVRMDQVLDEEEEKLNQERRQQDEEREERRLADIARRARLVASAKYSKQSVNPFDVLQITPASTRGWHEGKTLTEKQREVLRKQGIDPDSIPYAQAKQLIGVIFDRWNKKLCSWKQAAILQKRGLPTDVSFEEASRMITEISLKENWVKK